MRSFLILLILVFATAMASHTQTWTPDPGYPNSVDMAAVSHGSCHIYVQGDGEIRLSASGTPHGFKGKVYHHLALDWNGDRMVVVDEFWLANESEFKKANTRHPQLFFEECGTALPLLPSDILSALCGWRGLPVPADPKKAKT